MFTFAQRLASLDDQPFSRVLAEAAAAVVRDRRLYPNEVEPATRLVRAIRGGARTILLAHPMQSGKTNIMRAATHLLTDLVPDTRAIYITANDQLDFRQQNGDALAPYMEILSRTQRRKAGPWVLDRPTIVFFDESHFGDGTDMTIQAFLARQKVLDHPLAVFCGVSATPMSSLDCLDATIFADMQALEAAGYNSPAVMLRRGRIRRSEAMFSTPSRRQLGRSPEARDVEILADNTALKHLELLLCRPERSGYVLIRCRSYEAKALRAHLEGRWGSKVYVVDWNQTNRGFRPDVALAKCHPTMITVVLVQHKARMGTVIPTENCHFLFEHTISRGKVDVIAQSFLGRACGFGKQDHQAIVYSQPQVARAYSTLVENPHDTSRFAAYCEALGMQPSLRAEITHEEDTYGLSALEVFPAAKGDSRANIRRRCEAIADAYSLRPGAGHIRTLSRTRDPSKSGFIDAHGRPRRAAAEATCGPSPGDWSILIFDRVIPGRGRRPRVEEKGLILAIRGDRLMTGSACVEPRETSMHYHLRPRRRPPGQMSLGLGLGAVTLAARA